MVCCCRERFELLIVLEGTNETSNMTFQARSVPRSKANWFVLLLCLTLTLFCVQDVLPAL